MCVSIATYMYIYTRMHLYVKLNDYTCPYRFRLSLFGPEISLDKARRWQQSHTTHAAGPGSPATAVRAAGGCAQERQSWPGQGAAPEPSGTGHGGLTPRKVREKGVKRAAIRKFREEQPCLMPKLLKRELCEPEANI